MIARDINKDIDLIIQTINNMQAYASTRYWKELEANISFSLPLINIDPEQLALVAILAGHYLRESNLSFSTLLVIPLFSVVYAFNNTGFYLSDLNNFEITDGKLNTIKLHADIDWLLSYEQQTAFQRVLTFYNVDWDITLNNFKAMLTELKELKQNQTSYFSYFFGAPTVDSILSRYGKPACAQPKVEEENMEYQGLKYS